MAAPDRIAMTAVITLEGKSYFIRYFRERRWKHVTNTEVPAYLNSTSRLSQRIVSTRTKYSTGD
jgi:hypothetical protein